MPKCNSVLETEIVVFQREIRQNFPENCHFLHYFGLQNTHKPFAFWFKTVIYCIEKVRTHTRLSSLFMASRMHQILRSLSV